MKFKKGHKNLYSICILQAITFHPNLPILDSVSLGTWTYSSEDNLLSEFIFLETVQGRGA